VRIDGCLLSYTCYLEGFFFHGNNFSNCRLISEILKSSGCGKHYRIWLFQGSFNIAFQQLKTEEFKEIGIGKEHIRFCKRFNLIFYNSIASLIQTCCLLHTRNAIYHGRGKRWTSRCDLNFLTTNFYM
jgi:hypothetical protein